VQVLGTESAVDQLSDGPAILGFTDTQFGVSKNLGELVLAFDECF
jgi:hypothetical protein